MTDKEFYKILRSDNLEDFLKIDFNNFKDLCYLKKDLNIHKYSFLTGSALIIPFFNQKLKIANYILDNNKDIDYIKLFSEIINLRINLEYPEDFLKKILNKETIESLKQTPHSLGLLYTTNFFKQNRFFFEEIKEKDFDTNEFIKLIDIINNNKNYFKQNENALLNVINEISIQEKIPPIFKDFWKKFNSSYGMDRTLNKATLDKLIIFHPDIQSVRKLASNGQKQGQIESIIKKGDLFKEQIAKLEKEEIMKTIKSNKLNNNKNKVKNKRF